MLAPMVTFIILVEKRIIPNWAFLEALRCEDTGIFDKVMESSLDHLREYNHIRAVFMMHYNFQSNLGIQSRTVELQSIFQQYDQNGNGVLDAKEFESFVRDVMKAPEGSLRLSRDRIDDFIRVIDRDQRLMDSAMRQTKKGSVSASSGRPCVTFSGFRRFLIGYDAIDSADSLTNPGVKSFSGAHAANEADPSKASALMMFRKTNVGVPYRKKVKVYALRTRDAASFSKTWGDSKAYAGDYVIATVTADPEDIETCTLCEQLNSTKTTRA